MIRVSSALSDEGQMGRGSSAGESHSTLGKKRKCFTKPKTLGSEVVNEIRECAIDWYFGLK